MTEHELVLRHAEMGKQKERRRGRLQRHLEGRRQRARGWPHSGATCTTFEDGGIWNWTITVPLPVPAWSYGRKRHPRRGHSGLPHGVGSVLCRPVREGHRALAQDGGREKGS